MRLNLLPALLEESYAHLHSCLCAGLLQRKLFVQPFHRDVKVTPKVVPAMRSAMTYCKQVSCGGLTTPLVFFPPTLWLFFCISPWDPRLDTT